MSPVEIDQETMKKIFKESFSEAFHENRELLEDIIIETFEDIGLAEAIREGRKTEKVNREEIFKTLEQDN